MNRVVEPNLSSDQLASPNPAVVTASSTAIRPIVVPLGLVTVRAETPLLPRAAFVTITLASLLGAFFTGRTLGLAGAALLWRWSAFWALAASTGFLAWRSFYLRDDEPGIDAGRVRALVAAQLERVRIVRWALAPLLVVAALVPVTTGYLAPWQAGVLCAGAAVMAVLVLASPRNRRAGALGAVLGIGLLSVWGVADSHGDPYLSVVRGVHLAAFAAWLGGALFNLAAAVPAGRLHLNLDAVVAGARQLERFRVVVRTALPTIAATGAWMALRYAGVASPFWRGEMGWMISAKVGLILVLVVIFITCPLYRACSPVRGVCDLDDLRADAPEVRG